MSVIIRLQNLPWSANALDIRQYFQGLSIPEGGVHIVGGELGDAFIAFSTDEDARQAFNMTHGRIKEVQIKLMLSSRTEMQKVIEAARNQSLAAFIGTPTPPAPPNIAPPSAPVLVAPPPPSLSNSSQPALQIPLPQSAIQPVPIQSLLPSMVPEVREPFGDPNLQNQQLQQQQKLLQQQLQQVQQQQQQQNVVKESKDSNIKDRRRSRSRSRERRDRNRRDNRRRSRSRSRERRERRRRERSRSRDRRSSSRDKDRRSRDNFNRKSTEAKPNSNNAPTKSIGVWENPPPRVEPNLLQNPTLQLLGSLLPNANLLNLDPAVASLLPAAFDPWVQGQAIAASDIQLPSQQLNHESPNRSNNDANNSDNKSNSRDKDRDNRDRERGRDRGRDRDRDRDNDRDHNRNRDRDHNSDRSNSLDNKSDDGNRRSRNNRNDPEKNSCIRLFPYYGGFGEIRRFFTGLFINNTGIKFALSQFNEQTGVVLVRFATSKEKDKALERNGQTLKGMDVQITNLSDDDFENAKDPEAITNSTDGAFKNDPFTCLVIEDLPPFTTNHHLLKMFSDFAVLNIYIVQKQRAPSIGYIKFGSTEDAHKALSDKGRHSVEGKRVHVGPCKEEIFETIRKQQEGDQEKQNTKKTESDGATLYILLTDIPQKSNDRDVADFFSDIGILPANIIMLRNDKGHFIGETYCEFFTVDEARVAYQKKGMPMGASIVNMSYVTKQFMEMNIKAPMPNDIIMNNLNHNGPPHRLPAISSLIGGPGGIGILGMPNLPILQRPFFPRGMGRGMGMPGPMGPRGMMRMPRHPLNMHPRMNMRFPRPLHMMQQQMQQSPPMQQSGNQQQQYDDEEEIAPPGCTLLMENVPFKAELEEILEFFDGFDVSPDNVLRKYDAQGRPSGETKIIFNSPEEVFHVLQEKRGNKIRERNIYLSQC